MAAFQAVENLAILAMKEEQNEEEENSTLLQSQNIFKGWVYTLFFDSNDPWTIPKQSR